MQPTPEIQAGIDDVSLLNVGNPQTADKPVYRAQIQAMLDSPNPPIANGLPSFVRKQEQPVHRVWCYMALAGHSHKEIADQFTATTQTVGHVLRQPWAKQFMADEAKKIAGDAVEGLLKAESMNSARILIEIRDDEKVPARTRAEICRDLLDRTLGKPIQKVIQETSLTTHDATEESAKIDAELDELRKQVHGRN